MPKKKSDPDPYELFISHKASDEKDPKVKKYLQTMGKKFKDDIEKLELWSEYLKRSDKFKEVCEWFDETKAKHPYPPELKVCKHEVDSIEDYLVFVTNYNELRHNSPLVPLKENLKIIQLACNGVEIFGIALTGTFFLWAIDAGFAKKFDIDFLMNLFVFGNLYNNPPEITLLRIIHLIEQRNKLYCYKLGDIIDVIFSHIETDELFLNGRDATIEKYKFHLKRFLSSDFFLNISLLDPYENKAKTMTAINDLIEQRRVYLSEIDKSQYECFKPSEFEWHTGNIQIDELKRYLTAHDLKLDGKTNKEIAKTIYPNFNFKEQSTIRRVVRDRKKAEKIIKNVEIGLFPGKYN